MENLKKSLTFRLTNIIGLSIKFFPNRNLMVLVHWQKYLLCGFIWVFSFALPMRTKLPIKRSLYIKNDDEHSSFVSLARCSVNHSLKEIGRMWRCAYLHRFYPLSSAHGARNFVHWLNFSLAELFLALILIFLPFSWTWERALRTERRKKNIFIPLFSTVSHLPYFF